MQVTLRLMTTPPPIDPAARMQTTRDGTRYSAATDAATAICTLEFGENAIAGLQEDLYESRLSLADLKQLAEIVSDHARSGRPIVVSAHPATPTKKEPVATAPGRSHLAGPVAVWKYNVSAKNLPVCVEHSVFAENVRRTLNRGDVLLLQLRKVDARHASARITHTQIFDRYETDTDGISERLWGERFKYLIRGDVRPVTRPFNLEDLPLTRSYSTQGKIGPERVAETDREAILARIAAE